MSASSDGIPSQVPIHELQAEDTETVENTCGVTPISARVCVQLVAVKEATRESGIILPAGDSVDTYKADVIAVGDAVEYIENGNLVLLTIGAILGKSFLHRQEQYAIVDERDILAVLDR